MEIWQAIILGIVQGLTEFLPVSSSGHLVLLQGIFTKFCGTDFKDFELTFDIILHFATLLSVVVVCRKQIVDLFKKPYKKLLWVIISAIPAGLVGVLANDWIKNTFYGGRYLSIGFLITACLLFACNQVIARRKNTYPISLKSTIGMGCMQAVAVLPGISRSGSTMTAGVFFGLSPKDAVDFSFLMSIPVILGSGLLGIKDIVQNSAEFVAFCTTQNIIGLVLAFIAAALSGAFAVKWLKVIANKGSFFGFVIYLLLLTAVCITLSYNGVF